MSKNTTANDRNRGFDHDAIKWVRDQVRGITRDERLMLQYLATRCDTSHSCFPRQSLIAADLECSRSHVNTLLTMLELKELISRKRTNRSTIYALKIPQCPPVTTPGCRHSEDTRLSKGNDSKEPCEVTNEATKKIKVSVKNNGETSYDVTHEEKTGYKKKEKLGEKESSALSIVSKYFKVDPTRTTMAGFWFALMRQFHPEYKYPKRGLTKPQYKDLHRFFHTHSDQAYYLIAAAVCDWPVASEHACNIEGLPKQAIPKLGPTPTFINNASTGFADYWHVQWKKPEALKQLAASCNQEAA